MDSVFVELIHLCPLPGSPSKKSASISAEIVQVTAIFIGLEEWLACAVSSGIRQIRRLTSKRW